MGISLCGHKMKCTSFFFSTTAGFCTSQIPLAFQTAACHHSSSDSDCAHLKCQVPAQGLAPFPPQGLGKGAASETSSLQAVGDAPLVFMGCGDNANFFFKCELRAHTNSEGNVPTVLFPYRNAALWCREIQVGLCCRGGLLSPQPVEQQLWITKIFFLLQPRQPGENGRSYRIYKRIVAGL